MERRGTLGVLYGRVEDSYSDDLIEVVHLELFLVEAVDELLE